MQESSPRYTLKKYERLKSQKIIEGLFKEGKSVVIFPFRIVWLQRPLPTRSPVQFTVTVPVRAIPKAAHRNRIKRQVREAYRQQKALLYQPLIARNNNGQECQIAVMFIYLAKKELPSSLIFTKLTQCLKHISKSCI